MANDRTRYYSAGGHSSQPTGNYELTDYDRTSADMPIWNWLSGAGARRDQLQAAREADANRAYWDSLRPPSADMLSVDYQSADYDTSDRDAQLQALSQLQDWSRGGLTGADRQGLESQRLRSAQASRSQREALAQSAAARGMGGSGLDFAMQQQANQSGQQQASDAESQMLQGAQQRQIAATQASAALASGMRGQMEHETEYNTGIANQQQNADRDAIQQAYENMMNRAAGATQQYSTDAGRSAGNADRRDRETESGLGFIGGILESI